MKRLIVTKPGGHDRLKIVEMPDADLREGHVRVNIRRSGVNFADIAVRLGIYDAVKEYPTCPGFEFCGDVLEVGDGVSHLEVGDEVVGCLRFGAYADQAVADASLVWKRPTSLTIDEACAVPVNYATAWHALHGIGHVQPGEKVLIHSAAGGVGLAAAQLCRLAGAYAVGVVGRQEKIAEAERFGCRTVVLAGESDPWPAIEAEAPFDVICEPNGYTTLKRSYSTLRPAGRLVVYGFTSMFSRGRDKLNWPKLAWRFLRTPRFNPFDLVMSNKTVAGFNLVHLFGQDHLRDQLVEAMRALPDREGFIPPPVSLFPIADAAAAHALLESGRSIGKIVLSWD